MRVSFWLAAVQVRGSRYHLHLCVSAETRARAELEKEKNYLRLCVDGLELELDRENES